MKVGFTGTRYGMTDKQQDQFAELVRNLNPSEFHHGDCIGADDQAAGIFWQNVNVRVIVVHPPSDVTHRAYNGLPSTFMPAKTHFARNRDIVDETDVLIATPREMERQDRGGTWYTVDYALKRRKDVYLILPDGSVKRLGVKYDEMPRTK